MYTSNIEELRRIASEICIKHNTLCYSERDPNELVFFGFTWVENFYHVDPVKCAENLECVNTIFEMHSTILKLTLEDRYTVNTSRELLEETIKKLLLLSDNVH